MCSFNTQQLLEKQMEGFFAREALLPTFQVMVEKLQATSGRNEKEEILKQFGNMAEDIKTLLHFIYNPYITTGISKKKMKKDLVLMKDSIFTLVDDATAVDNILELCDYIKKNSTGRDADIRTVQYFIKKNLGYKDLIEAIVTKDLKIGVQPATLNKVYGKGFIPCFDCMLAQRYFEDPEKYLPKGTCFQLSTKLDGVRCLVIKDYDDQVHFFSRQGQPFYGLVDLEEEFKYLPGGMVYDGELLLVNDKNLDSKDLYRETVRVVNSDVSVKKNVTFNWFDAIAYDKFQAGCDPRPSEERKQFIHEYCTTTNEDGENWDDDIPKFQWIKEVEVLYTGTDQDQIMYWLDKITSEGGEGVMINLCDGPYEAKRSRQLLKVKRFQSADVLVTDVIEGTGSNVGKLGAIAVKFKGPDGNLHDCRVGSGFKQEERVYYWQHPEELLNKVVEIGYFEITNNISDDSLSLRFPTWKGIIRFDKDLDDLNY